MEEQTYTDTERRQFVRMDYTTPLAYKVCKQETLSKILEGYTVDISQAGLLCNLKDWVNIDDVMWLSFERSVLRIFVELEKRSLIYQNGVIGKVVRILNNDNGSYNVGVQFLTREEKI
ncbi:MAG: PilZ domain-containing protein [Candidatus Omnitrophota bacterium]